MADKFNPEFPPLVATELNARAKLPVDWMYKKYAYISMVPTGNSPTVNKSCKGEDESFMKIGDKSIADGNNTLYTGGGTTSRKLKPILNSVKVTNSGGGDYTNSYLYEIEASFTVNTLADINKVSAQYFKVGIELKIDFGWKGKSEPCNRGSLLASVYNFGFTMADDGSYSCNIKAMSAAALYGADVMAGDEKTFFLGVDQEIAGKTNIYTSMVEALMLLARQTFGIKEGDETPSAEGSLLERFKTSFTGTSDTSEGTLDNEFRVKLLDPNNASLDKPIFGILELEDTDDGFFKGLAKAFDYNDSTILYTPLHTLIDYINQKNAGLFKLNIIEASEPGGKISPDNLKPIGSANPARTLIPYAGDYGDSEIQPLKFTAVINAAMPDADFSPISKIFVEIGSMVEIYNQLQGQASGKTGEKKRVKTTDFLSKIFSNIETDTGGIVRLQTRPRFTNVDATNIVPTETKLMQMDIINRAMLPSAGETSPNPYTFKVLGPNSITRAVSLQSEFDSDMVMRATPKQHEDGSSNEGSGTKNLYKDECTQKAVKAAEPKPDSDLVAASSPTAEIANTTETEPAPEENYPTVNYNLIQETVKDNNSLEVVNASLAQELQNIEGSPERLQFAKPVSTEATLAEIKQLKDDLADNGSSPEKTTSLGNLIRKYVTQQATKGNTTAGSYSEIQMALSLSVTIDGISDVPYMAPIDIDRMPKIYKNEAVRFNITSIEHSFDGQGDWSTTYETMMRLKG